MPPSGHEPYVKAQLGAAAAPSSQLSCVRNMCRHRRCALLHCSIDALHGVLLQLRMHQKGGYGGGG
jgi:hypothetical protein